MKGEEFRFTKEKTRRCQIGKKRERGTSVEREEERKESTEIVIRTSRVQGVLRRLNECFSAGGGVSTKDGCNRRRGGAPS